MAPKRSQKRPEKVATKRRGSRSRAPEPEMGAAAPVVGMVSLGCAKNTVDSERVLGMVASAGLVISADPEFADIVLVNTCAFIAAAREETEQMLRELARSRPVVAIGCYPQRFRPKGSEAVYRSPRFPRVAAFVAFDAYDDLPAICARLHQRHSDKDTQDGQGTERQGQSRPSSLRSVSRRRECFDARLSGSEVRIVPYLASPRLRIGSPATAYLKIAEGCSNCCSYCAVPTIRRPLASVPLEKLLDEAEGLVGIGARELCVIAQDTASYGLDLYGKPRTHELLRKLCGIRGLRRVRLLYVHPAHLTDDILEVVAGERKVARYLDLPVQHASSRMLARMGRFHDGPYLRALIDRIRGRVRGIALRTSVIVGFPGEGALEFRELLDFVREAGFDHLGTFCYSRETGTRAARFARPVAAATARSRRDQIMRAQQRIAFEKLDRRVGGTETAMLELPCGRPGSVGRANAPGGRRTWIARTQREAPEVDGAVLVKGAPRNAAPGSFARVRIAGRSGYDLIARPEGGKVRR